MVDSGVTWQEVQDELGRTLTAGEQAQATTWITDAETLIGIRLRGHTADLDPDVLAMVVRAAAVLRLERRIAGGMSSVTVTADDGSVTRRFGENDTPTSGADWWFLPEWWGWLRPGSGDGAFTITPGRRAGRALDAERPL